jgi:glutamate synthase domain-containing protein 1
VLISILSIPFSQMGEITTLRENGRKLHVFATKHDANTYSEHFNHCCDDVLKSIEQGHEDFFQNYFVLKQDVQNSRADTMIN